MHSTVCMTVAVSEHIKLACIGGRARSTGVLGELKLLDVVKLFRHAQHSLCLGCRHATLAGEV